MTTSLPFPPSIRPPYSGLSGAFAQPFDAPVDS